MCEERTAVTRRSFLFAFFAVDFGGGEFGSDEDYVVADSFDVAPEDAYWPTFAEVQEFVIAGEDEGDDLTAVEIDFEVGDEPEAPPVAEVDDFFVPKFAGRADSHVPSHMCTHCYSALISA